MTTRLARIKHLKSIVIKVDETTYKTLLKEKAKIEKSTGRAASFNDAVRSALGMD